VTIRRADGLQWVAYRDGIAHAATPTGRRTLCDRTPTPDRYAWPARENCGVCVRVAMEKGAASKAS
jgi:hypothetical protein